MNEIWVATYAGGDHPWVELFSTLEGARAWAHKRVRLYGLTVVADTTYPGYSAIRAVSGDFVAVFEIFQRKVDAEVQPRLPEEVERALDEFFAGFRTR